MAIHQIVRAASQIRDCDLIWVDAKTVVKCRKNLAKINRPFGRFSTEAIRCADQLPGAHPSACQQSTRNSRPMIAPRIFINGWGPPEFAPNNNRNILVESALVQI